MKITLIKPNIGRLEHSLFVDEARMEPLQLGVIAALTPPDVEIELYDDRVEAIPFDHPTDLAAVTVETFTARRAYEICSAYQQRGVPVIVGGLHPTLLPWEAARFADAVYTGDAEFRWAEVVEDARRGNLKPFYHAPVGAPHPGILPRRDLFQGKDYLPVALTQYGRGCRFGCEFCAVSRYFDRKHYYREVEALVEEIETLGHKNLFFVDDNIISDHEAARRLFEALIPLKVNWVSQGSIDMTEDAKLMDLMAQSGCLGNVIGFESISPHNIRVMNKGPNRRIGDRPYQHQLKVLRDNGLQTWAAFTLGHDYDNVNSIHKLLEFALENRFTFAAFNVLMPYPETPFYARLAGEGRLLYGGEWWLHPEYRFNYAAFKPLLMSADELTEVGFACRKQFNSVPGIIRRALDMKTNMRSLYRFGIYAVYSRLFRQETFKKHGMRFGLNQ
jgi:radical SAM superfamily enzyme YgiQ (UPF0313 family)